MKYLRSAAEAVLALLPPADEAEYRMGLMKPVLWVYTGEATYVHSPGGGGSRVAGDKLLSACLARSPEAGRGTVMIVALPERMSLMHLKQIAGFLELPFKTTNNQFRVQGWEPEPPITR